MSWLVQIIGYNQDKQKFVNVRDKNEKWFLKILNKIQNFLQILLAFLHNSKKKLKVLGIINNFRRFFDCPGYNIKNFSLKFKKIWLRETNIIFVNNLMCIKIQKIIIECTNIFRDRLIKNNENWIHFSRIVGHCRTLLTFQHWFTYRIYVYFFPLIVQIAMELVLQTVCVLFSYVFLSKQIVSKSFYSDIALKWREKRVSKARSWKFF